jgi:apolipoprotein D and lipocalin family protein
MKRPATRAAGTLRGKASRALVALLLAGVAAACASRPAPPLATVSQVDVARYLGEWHQVATIPAWFQRQCVADTTATYARADDGLIAVRNACRTEDGSVDEATGRARFVGEGTDGKLEVTFFEVFGYWLWPVAGDYWIVALDPDYRWSVVGHPSRDYAWVLARSPRLDDETLRAIDRLLADAGYDTCTLLLTMPDERGRLCDVSG